MGNECKYICIEGLDGSGKTTVITSLEKEFKSQNLKINILSPTKMSNPQLLIERLYKKYKVLRKSRFYRAGLYAKRSNDASKKIDWNSGIVLGDRSLITSYVVKWSRNTVITKIRLFIVNILENRIPAPDYVIFINVPQEVLMERIKSRNEEIDIDETSERSNRMREAYHYFMNQEDIKRIKKVKWISINGDDSRENVLNRIKEIINQINNNEI